MKQRILKIAYVALWVLLFSGAALLVGFVEVEQYDRTCKRVEVNVDYGKADMLLSQPEIDTVILKTAGMLKGKPLGYINTGAIESAIAALPYTAKVSVYENNQGVLFVEVKQREPLLRIINRDAESYYLDGSGSLLPVSQNFTARLLVATGEIGDSYLSRPNYRVNLMSLADSIYIDSLMTHLYKLAMYITHDAFLKAQIDQIYVNGAQEFELIPRVGSHVILLGDANDLEEKFRKLYAFYRFGLNKIGWNKYSIINIKYKNQVVCTK